MKKVSILLTKYLDPLSSLVYYVTGRGYTHISLGLEEEEADRYYSFNFKGFCVETIEKHRRRGVDKSIYYQIEITDESYQILKETIQQFEENREVYRYTKAGVLFAMLHMPFQRNNYYFCSQFVAELLIVSGAMALRKSANLYLPNHLSVELERFCGLRQVIPNVV